MRSLSRLVRAASSTLAGILLAAPLAAAGVIVVDAAGGGDFTTVGAAIGAAMDGDILVIRPGDYTAEPALDTAGKALVIVGDTGGTTLLPVLTVDQVAAGKTAVLRHLSFEPSGFGGLPQGTVRVTNNLGRVHIEDCQIRGRDGESSFLGLFANPGETGLLVLSSAAVAVHRCTITGGQGIPTSPGPFGVGQQVPSNGGLAIEVESCALSLHHVTATGGDGGSGAPTDFSGADGAHALRALFSPVIVSGCTLQGGDGGSGDPSGASGSGVVSNGTGAALSEVDSSLLGGAGAPGLMVLSGTHDVWTGEAWSLAISSPVRSGSVGTLTASGPPNEAFALFISFGMGYLPKPGFRGAFLPGSPFFGPLVVATTNGSGSFSANFLAPSLVPFGLEGLLNIDQALMVQDDGLVLSSATAFIQVQPPN
jgi:hypothetical protein